MKELDALIVGMGPTGATLAGLLGQRGLRVAVFDRLPDLYPLPRAIGMDHEAMRVAQELGLTMVRAGTVGAHPRFVRMARELIEERLGRRTERRALGAFGITAASRPVTCSSRARTAG